MTFFLEGGLEIFVDIFRGSLRLLTIFMGYFLK